MRRSIGGVASLAIEKVTGAASANVDTIVLPQAEIEDFGAAVIERNSLTPSDLGQLLIGKWRRHRYVFMDGQDRIAKKSHSGGKGIGRQHQCLCLDGISAGGMK